MTGREDDDAAQEAAVRSREYPARPIVGVGGVVVVPMAGGERGIVLIKRRYPPLAGRWSLPGGTQEVGETLQEAVARELLEETGLLVEVGPVLIVFDRITRDAAGRVHYHYVLVDYACRPVGGRLEAGSDVSDVAVVAPGELPGYDLTPETLDVIGRALGWPAPAPPS